MEPAMTQRYHDWLLALTGIPTAAGCEDRVVAWVTNWIRKRRGCTLAADRFGNLMLRRRGARSTRPIVLTAHLDHPAFVVTAVRDAHHVRADFRGGVGDAYFVGAKVLLYLANESSRRGVITKLAPKNAKAFRLLGYTQKDMRRTDAAIKAFKTYLRLSPEGEYADEIQAIIGELSND